MGLVVFLVIGLPAGLFFLFYIPVLLRSSPEQILGRALNWCKTARLTDWLSAFVTVFFACFFVGGLVKWLAGKNGNGFSTRDSDKRRTRLHWFAIGFLTFPAVILAIVLIIFLIESI